MVELQKDLEEYRESLRNNIEEMEDEENEKYYMSWAVSDWRQEVADCTHIIKLIKKTKSLADLKQAVLAHRKDDHPQVCNYALKRIEQIALNNA